MELTNRIEDYWSRRSNDFCELKMSELNSEKRNLWMGVIVSCIKKILRI